MKQRNKRISILLVFVFLLLCLFTSCGKTTIEPTDVISKPVNDFSEPSGSASEEPDAPETAETVPMKEQEEIILEKGLVLEKEYERALAYGLVPAEWENDLKKSISFKEFCGLVSSLIQITAPEKLDVWNELAVNAMESNEAMQRNHGAVGLLHAAQALDCCYIHGSGYSDIKQIEQHPGFFDISASPFEPWPDLPANFQMLQRTPGSPMSTEFYHGSWGDAASTAQWFVIQRRSLLNEAPLLSYDESYNMRWLDDLTREEAICAVLRLGESESNLLEGNSYISVYDHTNYDTSIITDELLSTPSDLPEPTHETLPSTWKGVGISKVKDTVNSYYRDFQEAEVAFLAENGFNFTRVFFNFNSLRYPEFSEDMTLINEQELRELDQMIAWGIKHDVHIQLSLSNTFEGTHSFDMDDAAWELYHAYWEALAARYAGIPARYLSFDLANELMPSPENVPTSIAHLRDTVQSIRTADENRVLVISFHSNPSAEWVDGVASLGLSLAYHPYYPTHISDGGAYTFSNTEPPWPYPYFPQVLLPNETLTVSGDIGGKTLQLDFWAYEPFRVTFDNGESVVVDVPGDYIDENSCGYRFHNPYPVDIPEGVTKLTLQPISSEIRLQGISVKSKGSTRWLVPHDVMSGVDIGSADLIWSDGDGWSSSKKCDAEFVYQNRLVPLMNVAKKYNVGFMVNEFGSFAAGIGWNASLKQQYDSDMIVMMEAHDIPWCMCELDFVSDPIDESFDEWNNTTVKKYTHISDNGHRHTIQYSAELLEMYRGYAQE